MGHCFYRPLLNLGIWNFASTIRVSSALALPFTKRWQIKETKTISAQGCFWREKSFDAWHPGMTCWHHHNPEVFSLQSASLQVCKSAVCSLQVCSLQVCSLQVCKSASLQVCKSASLQVCSLQVCKSAVCKSAVCTCRTPGRLKSPWLTFSNVLLDRAISLVDYSSV